MTHDETWTPAEPEEVLDTFRAMLAAATGDGAKKRQTTGKPSWKIDPGHETAIFSHLWKWKRGEMADPDSGAHPLVHLAWRALAIAYQETAGTVYTHKWDKTKAEGCPPGAICTDGTITREAAVRLKEAWLQSATTPPTPAAPARNAPDEVSTAEPQSEGTEGLSEDPALAALERWERRQAGIVAAIRRRDG